ncbi:MAG: class I SAM-dependent methyltransferase, partial [Acidobacteriaceae bacterium]|nr:class I SAM-dependent methyltransferase [Acidobacteriaceae bacterium]
MNCHSDAQGRFSIAAAGGTQDPYRLDIYSAAIAFIAGTLSVQGDIFAAIRSFLNRPHKAFRDRLFSIMALPAHRLKTHAAQNIQFHYDRSNEFYSLFLDPHIVYSEAHFDSPEQSLDEAQRRKLERVCQALDLKRGETLLDVGCGWGGLITYAAEHCGVTAFGCTLSKQQLAFVRDLARQRGLAERITIQPLDYRELSGPFHKIASIGMFEHVGRRNLGRYFRKMYS